jgi:histone acetyltransferase (RNA polymerase elongator complex component)
MNDEELRLSKREYTAQKVLESSELIQKNNLELGIQLMPGLPGYTENSIMETSYKTCAIQPDFLRIYPALVIKNTLLEQGYLKGDYKPLFLNQAVRLCKKMLILFQSYNIPVIRLGLQPTETLLSPGSIVAGPFHSAFHQLVISSIFYDSLHEFLKENKNITSPLVNFLVHPTELSNFIGHKKENIKKFKKAFKNFTIRFSPDKLTPKRSFRIHNNVFPIIRAIPN